MYIASGIQQFDTLLAGHEHISASFLIEGTDPALVETGSQSSADRVKEALAVAGMGPNDLRWIIVTHVHLDHAGAAGDLVAAFPRATVLVHEAGARHLIDPEKLVASAARVYGERLDTVYGRMTASPADRVVPVPDRMEIEVAPGRTLLLLHSPGHAKHHIAVLDQQTGTLMAGDAVGVLIPEVGVLRPATPPPNFDLALAIESLRTFRELRPETLVLTHYGPVEDADATLIRAEAQLRAWVAVARDQLISEPDTSVRELAKVFETAFADDYAGIPPDEMAMFDLLNGMESNAAGISRYLSLHHDALLP